MGSPPHSLASGKPGAPGLPAYAAALAMVAAVTALLRWAPGLSHIANASMVFLLAVIASAVLWGSGPAVVASVASFLAFDWFLVEPLHTLTVSDPGEWLALLTFLVTAVTTGQLTALLRSRAEEARRRERETAALAEASLAIATRVDTGQALSEVLRRMAEVMPVRALRILISRDEEWETASEWGASEPPGREVLRFVAEQRRPLLPRGEQAHWEKALAELGERPALYLPLLVEARVVGVLFAELAEDREVTLQEQRVVESLANHAAVVLERDRLTRAHAHAEALQEADRLKTALLSMVSHDFRSPLAGIKAGVTTLLETDGEAGAGERELLEGIDRETDRLNRMVGNILALSRLESGAWRPQREPTPPEDLLGPALSPFPAEVAARVKVQVAPGITELNVDPVQISQVLHNLVDNALKYSPAATAVEVRLGREDGDLVVEVADRGPGLPPGEEERVFEPFHRAADQRESALPGVGLGLAVCRGLVAAHGGTLTARNRRGGGACFAIRLPAE